MKEQNGKYYKQCQVVMLATNEATCIGYYMTKLRHEINYKKTGTLLPQHLYFLSDDEIKESDWVYSEKYKKILQFKEPSNRYFYKKIIATTDESLRMYIRPSDSFIKKYIEEYNAGRQITDVLVEYEWVCSNCNQDKNHPNYEKCHGNYRGHNVIKVDSNNNITIAKLKDSYSREEVLEIAHAAWMKGALQYQNPDKEQSYTEFIKENL